MTRKKENHEEIEKRALAKAANREKKKKAKMNVSGKSVFKLREIIVRKPKSVYDEIHR